jgi:hypothetical protein
MATNCTSGWPVIHRRSCMPRPRMPMPPMMIFSLGGTAPLRPKADEGTIVGAATAAPT